MHGKWSYHQLGTLIWPLFKNGEFLGYFFILFIMARFKLFPRTCTCFKAREKQLKKQIQQLQKATEELELQIETKEKTIQELADEYQKQVSM